MTADNHSSRVLTYVACLHDEYPPFPSRPACTSLDVAHPLLRRDAQLLDQGQHQT